MSTSDAPTPDVPSVEGHPPRILIVRAPYYRQVVDRMSAGALNVLATTNARTETVDVAGAFELPQVIRLALRGSTAFDGFLAIGCVVRGETDHYEYICRATLDGLMQLSLVYAICLGTAVLTVDNLEQALARSKPEGPNKGAEAAAALLGQVNAARRLGAA